MPNQNTYSDENTTSSRDPNSIENTSERNKRKERSEPTSKANRFVSLQSVGFVEWQPTAVLATAATGDGVVLAAVRWGVSTSLSDNPKPEEREGGSIEIWSVEHWSLVTRIPITQRVGVQTCAVWLRNDSDNSWRLLTGGLDGFLTEWDVLNRTPKERYDSEGGAVWAMAVQDDSGSESRIAVACNDGCLRIFHSTEEEELVCQARLFASASRGGDGPARLLSTSWHPSGHVVAGSSDGFLYLWDVKNRHEIMQIPVSVGDKEEACKEVWAVAVLICGTIVTGGARGTVQFWDGSHGSRLAISEKLESDVFAVAASPDGKTVFASGADHRVASFGLTPGDSGQPANWLYLDSKDHHTHDVRTLTVVSAPGRPAMLVSGGLDARVFVYSISNYTKEHPFMLTIAPDAPAIAISKGGNSDSPPLLLSAQRESCDLWQLASDNFHQDVSTSGGRSEGQSVEISEGCRHVAELSTAPSDHIYATAVSDDQSAVAIADSKSVQLFRLLRKDGSQLKLADRCQIEGMTGPAAGLGFAGQNLVIVAPTGAVSMASVEDGKVAHVITIPDRHASLGGPRSALMKSTIRGIAVTSNGLYAAVLRPMDIWLLDLRQKSHYRFVTAPEGSGMVTAAAFGPLGDMLAFSTTKKHLYLYNIQAKTLMDLSQDLEPILLAKLAKMPGEISGISFLPEPERKAAMISTNSSICFVDFEESARPPPPVNKRYRRTRAGLRPPKQPDLVGNTRVIDLPNICLGFSFTTPHQAVLVDKDWRTVLSNFPAPVYRKRFGIQSASA